MYCPKLQIVGYWSYLAALAVASAGILLANESVVRIGAGFLALSLATLAFNVATMLAHLVRPKLEPLATPSSLIPKIA
jgi:hypothetical protein